MVTGAGIAYTPPMRAFFADDEEQTIFPVALDDLTVARLMEVCEEAKVPPAILIAALVRDVLDDDAIEHGTANESDTVIRGNSNKDLN